MSRTVTQGKGIPYQRHKPSAALREFLDPLDPGSYFDCGRARLHGLDDALLQEAESRGRNVGDDSFQLVATDMGLVFCRPSISFAIAARWEEVQLIRPHGEDPVILPVTWPTHGELKFTVSKRLAGNIFRRWLQLRMQAARLTRDQGEDSDLQSEAPANSATDLPAAHVEPDAPDGADVLVEQELGDWEVVSKVDPPPTPEPEDAAEPAVAERRDTGISVKRRKLDERGAERRRIDRPLILSAFDAETSLPFSDSDAPSSAAEPSIAVESDAVESDAVESDVDEVIDEPSDQPEDEHAWPVHQKGSPDQPPGERVVAGEVGTAAAAADLDPDPSEVEATAGVAAGATAVEVEEEAVEEAEAKNVEPEEPVAADSRADSAIEAKRDVAVDGAAESVSAATGVASRASEPAGELYGAGVRSIAKPETTPTSWIGSPLSLVAAVVAISTGVLMLTLAVSVYRWGSGSDLESASADTPVGRTTINHQRFNPDGDSSEPLRSAALDPASLLEASTTTTAADPLSPVRSDEVLGNQPRLCNSNYSGCVADVSDVDCPGDGDGPVFSEESAVVMGEDVYQLDTDGDGETCEADQPRLEEEDGVEESTSAELEPTTP